ncbi:14591_t:CDS:2, partial [Racocetra fulgida]
AQQECQLYSQSQSNATDTLNSGDSDSNSLSSVNIVTGSEKSILYNIADIKTRWNSKYHSWKRLLKLHVPNFRHEESSDDDSDDSEYDRSESTNDSSPNTNTIKLMRHTIYNSLFDYWNELLMVGLLASLLDPWNEEAQKKAKTELTHQFKNITDSNYEQTTTSIYTTSSGDSNIRRN